MQLHTGTQILAKHMNNDILAKSIKKSTAVIESPSFYNIFIIISTEDVCIKSSSQRELL